MIVFEIIFYAVFAAILGVATWIIIEAFRKGLTKLRYAFYDVEDDFKEAGIASGKAALYTVGLIAALLWVFLMAITVGQIAYQMIVDISNGSTAIIAIVATLFFACYLYILAKLAKYMGKRTQ